MLSYIPFSRQNIRNQVPEPFPDATEQLHLLESAGAAAGRKTTNARPTPDMWVFNFTRRYIFQFLRHQQQTGLEWW